MQFEILLGAITVLVSLGLGLFVYLRDRASWTNRFFAILSVIICAYAVINYLFLHPLGGPGEGQLFWVRMVSLIISFIGPVAFGLLYVFPRAQRVCPPLYFYSVSGLAVASATASLLLPLVFNHVEYFGGGGIISFDPGTALLLLDSVGLLGLGFVVLGWRYRSAAGMERGQILQFLIGLLVSVVLMGVVTVILVTFSNTFDLVSLGPIFAVLFLASMAYAIVRYHLFNLKIFTTQALVGVSWMIFLTKLLVPASFEGKMIDVVIFIFALILGSFLVRSVHREISQREQLEGLTTRLEAANVKLTDLSRSKTELLSLASHQIKSPLAAIKGYATLLKDGSFGVLPVSALETVAKVQRSADQLFELVNSLLDLRKAEEGRMDYQFAKTDLVPLTRGVVEELGQLASLKKIRLEFTTSAKEVMVNADAQKLRQVLQNIIDNAIKYTPAGSVGVSLDNLAGQVTFTCTDTGYGMKKEVVDRLFTEFMRDERLKKMIRGTGLGLYIAKKIVEAHGGSIRCESNGEGLGSTFMVALRPAV